MLKVVYLFVATLIASAALHGGPAMACDTCGCQDAAAAPACDCPAGECACGPKDGDKTACADCPMSGDCACQPAGCPFSGAPSQDAANLPDWHVKSPAGLNVSLQQIEAFEVAYLPGTFADELEGQYGKLMAAADAQGLLNGATHAGAFLPGVQYTEPAETSVINVAIWNTANNKVGAPIQSETIPGGTYMIVQHWGGYDAIGETYMRAISWAQENGIEFRDGPSFLHNVTDPAGAPMEQWLTEIYLPFAHSAS